MEMGGGMFPDGHNKGDTSESLERELEWVCFEGI